MSEEEEKTPKRPRRPRPTGPLRRSALHLDARGRARMVDVGSKATTRRRAVARGRVRLNAAMHTIVTKRKIFASKSQP